MSTATFSHTGSIGDCWASMPTMREYYKKTGNKIILYLIKDVRAFYYEGATHPTKTDDGKMCMLNQSMIDMMKPLFMAQSFIEDVRTWKDEKIDFPLEMFRDAETGLPSFSINRWYFYIYPDLSCDLSGVWLDVPDAEKDLAKGKVIITRSERYRNDKIDYSFLKPYEDDLLFCGTMREYNNFCMMFDLNIKKLVIKDFLELAQAIKQCKFHITNQTQAFQLSEGQKIPRILELCKYAPNCIPIGKDAYDFFIQQGLEWAFNHLNGTEQQFMEKVKASLESKKALVKNNVNQI